MKPLSENNKQMIRAHYPDLYSGYGLQGYRFVLAGPIVTSEWTIFRFRWDKIPIQDSLIIDHIMIGFPSDPIWQKDIPILRFFLRISRICHYTNNELVGSYPFSMIRQNTRGSRRTLPMTLLKGVDKNEFRINTPSIGSDSQYLMEQLTITGSGILLLNTSKFD
jgi:hypothetical protein